METLEEFESIKKVVRELLETDPNCRNSDKFLIFRILKQTTNLNLTFQEFDRCPNFESIRRIRQKLFEENPALRADSEVEEARQTRRNEITQLMKPNERTELSQVVRKSRGIEINKFIPDRTHGIILESK